jgi:phosphohistidine swiveling domain-containing protein
VREKGAGRVCILPGSHKLSKTVNIIDFQPKKEAEEVRSQSEKAVLTIYGCGPQTQIFGPNDLNPAFHLERSAFVQISSLTIEVEPAQNAMLLQHCNFIKISDCITNIASENDGKNEVVDPTILKISDSNFIIIENNIFICRQSYKHIAIAVKANHVQFSGNKLISVGIWVQDSSRDIFIQENLIVGSSSGIILGGRTTTQVHFDEPVVGSKITDDHVVGITITDNFIADMDNSGICTMMSANQKDNAVLLTGLGVAPGMATGVVRIIANFDELDKVKAGDIMVTKMTISDMIPQIRQARGIITDDGGIDCHAADMGRRFGFPVVVGTENATSALMDGMKVTIDGDRGLVYVDMMEMGGTPKSDIDDLLIHRNRIIECAQKGINERILNRAVGGIVLLNTSNVRIAENYISDNGNADSSPACGIFVSMCHYLEVIDNNIINNGASCKSNSGNEVFQAGIVAIGIIAGSLTAKSWAQPNAESNDPDFRASIPAANIKNNVVVSPSGQALILTGIGHMSISDNSFTSQGQWHQPIRPLNKDLNCSIYIFNYGCSQVFMDDFAGLLAEIGDVFGYPELDSVYEGIDGHPSKWIMNYPYGQVLFNGNQITFQMAIEENNQENMANLIDTKIMDGFRDVLDYVAKVSGHSKQRLSHNLIASSVFIASGDDISIQDNQITCNVMGRIFLTNVAALAPTIRTSGNRFSDSLISLPEDSLVTGAIYSCFTVGIMNLATDNQANNCIYTFGTFESESKNQVKQRELCRDLQEISPKFEPPSLDKPYYPTG